MASAHSSSGLVQIGRGRKSAERAVHCQGAIPTGGFPPDGTLLGEAPVAHSVHLQDSQRPLENGYGLEMEIL